MTFLEAAFEVLRREGKALHFKDLTKLAIKLDLLSVVGRDPEQMMQTRLQAEVRRPSSELVRTSPGVFGLRSYPPKSELAPTKEASSRGASAKGAQLELPASGDAAKPAGERTGKRRGRGERGAGKSAAAESTAASPAASPTENKPEAKPEAAPEARTEAKHEAKAKNEAKTEGARKPERSRGRRGGRGEKGRREDEAAAVGSTPPAPEATPAAATEAPSEAATAATSEATEPVRALTVEPTAPVATEEAAAPAPSSVSPRPVPASAPSAKTPPPTVPSPAESAPAGAAPSSISPTSAPPASSAQPTERAPAAPPPSSGTPRPHRPTPPPAAPLGGAPPSTITPSSVLMPAGAPVGPVPGPVAIAPPPAAPRPEPAPRVMTLADAAYDVLRGSSEGRPLGARQIAEIALKRRLLRGEPGELGRALRAALVREQRQRDSDGLRPRIRSLGQGQYMLSDRKLEPELYNAERELLDRLNRAREATRVALRRRLRGLGAGAFELLTRLLLERLGMLGAELIKRGDGVAYFATAQTRGSRSIKVLVAVRPGEAELSREAIGELRAGLKVRGFDEGLVLCAGRASPAALTEAAAASGQGTIDVYDQETLTDLLIRHQIGIRRMHLPMDYLDTDLWTELAEPSGP